ncbi:MAG: extracellular solute-binding protein [Phormidesmis sp.]
MTVGSLLTSCSPATDDLNIMLLDGAVPPEVLKRFRQQATTSVRFHIDSQIEDIFQQLQTWQQPPEKAPISLRRFLPWQTEARTIKPNNLVSLGDYWLTSAIAQDLLAPLEIAPQTLGKLPPVWQQFVRRDSQGQSIPLEAASEGLWAAPYKMQSLAIIYRRSQFPSAAAANGSPFQRWRDLLQPQLNRRIALPDHPRIVIGLLQKIRSGRFNPSFESDQSSLSTSDSQLAISELAEPFAQLNQQVKTYDSRTSIKALVNEDVDAVVGWSGDAVAALSRYRDLEMTIPEEGSLLSADMWVRPKGAEMSASAQDWIDFCWQEGPATQISIAGKGLSPIFFGEGMSWPNALNNELPSAAILKNSEPLLPLPPEVKAAYLKLWQQLRASDRPENEQESQSDVT